MELDASHTILYDSIASIWRHNLLSFNAPLLGKVKMKWDVCVQQITPLLFHLQVHKVILIYIRWFSRVPHGDFEERVGQPLTEFPAIIIDWRANMRKERSLGTRILFAFSLCFRISRSLNGTN